MCVHAYCICMHAHSTRVSIHIAHVSVHVARLRRSPPHPNGVQGGTWPCETPVAGLGACSRHAAWCLLLADASQLCTPASPSPLPPASPPGSLAAIQSWPKGGRPSSCAPLQRSTLQRGGGFGSARSPSRGGTRPVSQWGGKARASRRYALVPEPKIAGDAWLPRRGSGDVTGRQSPAAPRSSAEEWERASPSIPPRASFPSISPRASFPSIPPRVSPWSQVGDACAGKRGSPSLMEGRCGPAVLGTSLGSPQPWVFPLPCAEDAALLLMVRAG